MNLLKAMIFPKWHGVFRGCCFLFIVDPKPLASKLETLRFSPQKGTGNFFGRCDTSSGNWGKNCRIGSGETIRFVTAFWPGDEMKEKNTGCLCDCL